MRPQHPLLARSRSLGRAAALATVVALLGTPAPADARRRDRPAIGTIELSRLPAEAQRTVDLVLRGGPFPYRRDGVVFENREGRLPRRGEHFYREYTVPTPGRLDRGPRRLVVGGDKAEFYYSDDHYRSFRRVGGVP